MRIASVTFYSKIDQIGGGFTPALAFKSWAMYFGQSCDLVGFCDGIGETIPSLDFVLLEGDEDFLNSNYDCIFFSTPPIFCEFDFSKIKKPFMVMWHGELDHVLYSTEFVDSPFFIGCPHIDDKLKHSNNLLLHPCVPVSDAINWEINIREGNGILYAARICNWVNCKLAARMSKFYDVHMFGPVNNERTRIEMDEISKKLSTYSPKPFLDRKDVYENVNANMFWDAIGNPNKPVKMRRLSLSSYEALGAGFLPIINSHQCPEFLAGTFIEIDSINDSELDIHRKIDTYLKLIQTGSKADELNYKIQNSRYGFKGIENMYRNVIEHFNIII